MVKDKTQIIIPPINIRKSREIPIIIAIILLGLVLWQWNTTGGLRTDIKDRDRINEQQEVEIKDLNQSIEILKDEKQAVLKRADSFELKEKYYKTKYYVTNKKLKDVLSTYGNSTVDDKNKLFTRSLHN